MTCRHGNVVFLEPEAAKKCEECGDVAETRPYGKGGTRICFPCMQKPENKAQVEQAFRDFLEGL